MNRLIVRLHQHLGMTSDSVFGSGRTCCNSLVQPKEKKESDPTMTTSDIANLYVPLKDKRKKPPMFRRTDFKAILAKK